MYCESKNRLQAIVDLCDRMHPSDWLTLLGENWQRCDNTGAYASFILFKSPVADHDGPIREMMTTRNISSWTLFLIRLRFTGDVMSA